MGELLDKWGNRQRRNEGNMEKEIAFHILEIPETKDEPAIQSAYRMHLKTTNPEDAPEDFKRLRQAYETALGFARQKDEEKDSGPKNEVDLWVERVEEFYRDLPSRYKINEWRRLLADPVCEGLDTSLEAREKLLAFLMNHIHLPHTVWKLIEDTFQIVEDLEELKQLFPVNFLNYVKHYIENDTFLPFELFEYRSLDGENANGDGYIDDYLNIKRQMDSGENGDYLQALDDLQAYDIYHPYEDVERLRLLIQADAAGKYPALIEKLSEKAPEYQYVRLYLGEAKWSTGEKEAAYEIWQGILKETPDYYRAKYNVVRYLMEKEDYYQARELMHELLEYDERDETVQKLLQDANDKLIMEYQGKLQRGEEDSHFPGDELKLELGWCLFQNERCEEAAQLLEGFTPAKEQEYGYCNLYGRLLYHMQKYEKAQPYLEQWLGMLRDLSEDGTEETRKRISRKNMAASILGACYHELGQKEKAEKTLQEAIRLAADEGERLGSMQQLAGTLLQYHQYERAVDICDQMLQEDQQYYPAYLIRQEACYELKKGQEVVDDYHRAIDIFPGYYRPYMFAAEVFFHYEQYEDGKKVLELARENGIALTSRMKLYEIKILRNLARSPEDREEPKRLLEELRTELQSEECDLEDKSEVEFEQALLCWDENDIQKALYYIKQAIQKNPDRMQYHMVCGNIYVDNEDFDAALEEYSKAEEEYEDSPGLYYGRGLCFEGLGSMRSAIAEFEKTLKLRDVYGDACEKMSDYYRNLYNLNYRKENLEKAVCYASRQLEATENCYYLVNRGLLYMNALELELAIRDFEKALEYREDDWPSWNNLGCCYKYLGQFEKAIGYFEKAVEYMGEKKDILPYSNMADCYEGLGDYQKAIECYRKDLEMFPDRLGFWEEIGDLYSYMGQYKNALDAYEKSKDKDEWYNDYYSKVGNVWLKSGDRKKCIHYYKKGIRVVSGMEKARRLYDLGQLYCDVLQEYQMAIYYFKKAININSDQTDLFDYERYIAKACYLRKDYEEAKKHAQNALTCFKHSDQGELEDYLAYKPYAPARAATMGWLYLCMGKTEEAVRYFRSMEQMQRCKQCRYQKCFESRLYMGDFYASRGEYDKALQEYQNTLERNPHCEEAQAAIENIKK